MRVNVNDEAVYGFLLGTTAAYFAKEKGQFSVSPRTIGLGALFVFGCTMAGNFYHHYRKEKFRLRQLFLEDYIEKHPDDFPQFTDRKKLKDVFEAWPVNRT